ncbi:membrane protein insertase YidC [Haloimpatiens sp. FM7330]|uniref:membrane protein insertase YidC n=1 Tax=Haloimpatiens sp. FM7330 TaxID=3298610 RepID=UPI0036280832
MHYLTEWLSKFFEMLHGSLSNFIPNDNITYGLSIILFTIIVRVILIPVYVKQIKSTSKMSEIQPQMKTLQQKYKNDPQKYQQEMMKLYKENGANPLSGCLPLIVQMPILFSLYWVFMNLKINGVSFLWIKDLGALASFSDITTLILPIVSGITTYISSSLMAIKSDNAQSKQMTTTNIVMSVFFTWFSLRVKGALVLYWVTNNLFQIAQTVIMQRAQKLSKKSA